MDSRPPLPTLDAHVHISHSHSRAAVAAAGAALAVTLSLEEASRAVGRADPVVGEVDLDRKAAYSRFSTLAPLQSILVETDLGYEQAPASIPVHVELAERLLAQKRGLDGEKLRRVLWVNFARLLDRVGAHRFISEELNVILNDALSAD